MQVTVIVRFSAAGKVFGVDERSIDELAAISDDRNVIAPARRQLA